MRATPNSVAEIIEALESIIELARRAGSRIGYFTALYRHSTHQIRDDIDAGRFADGERAERLAVNFAARFLFALERFRQSEHAGDAWQVTFEAVGRCKPTIVQHLLLAVNAHVNFDLGPAVLRTSPGHALADHRADFDRVNDIMFATVRQIVDRIGELSPWIRLIDLLGGNTDDAIINFSIADARRSAWRVADHLNRLTPEEQSTGIEVLDRDVAAIGRKILNPGPPIGTALCVVRAAESRDVRHNIDRLNED